MAVDIVSEDVHERGEREFEKLTKITQKKINTNNFYGLFFFYGGILVYKILFVHVKIVHVLLVCHVSR